MSEDHCWTQFVRTSWCTPAFSRTAGILSWQNQFHPDKACPIDKLNREKPSTESYFLNGSETTNLSSRITFALLSWLKERKNSFREILQWVPSSVQQGPCDTPDSIALNNCTLVVLGCRFTCNTCIYRTWEHTMIFLFKHRGELNPTTEGSKTLVKGRASIISMIPNTRVILFFCVCPPDRIGMPGIWGLGKCTSIGRWLRDHAWMQI